MFFKLNDSSFLFSVMETDWSIDMANVIATNEWSCSKCQNTFYLNNIQKLQHINGKFNVIQRCKILQFMFVLFQIALKTSRIESRKKIKQRLHFKVVEVIQNYILVQYVRKIFI